MIPPRVQPTDHSTGSVPTPTLSNEEARKAAVLIQRTYRGHRTRRELRGCALSASARWDEAIKDARFRVATAPRPPRTDTEGEGEEGKGEDAAKSPARSNARENWKRAAIVARRAGQEDPDDDDDENDDGNDNSNNKQKKMNKASKTMGLEYFLELVDHKHRHGSNLRKYHAHWQRDTNTKQNFFYWLDHGDGKDLDLVDECSRARLEQMQVRYLSREERLNYLVRVDGEGLLVWAKNGERVWTKDELYRDSLLGIVPVSDPTPMFRYNVPPTRTESDPEDGDDDDDEDDDEEEDDNDSSSSEDNHHHHHHHQSKSTTRADSGEQYIDLAFHRARGPAKLKYVNANIIFNQLMRRSLQKGHKWIFVCDRSFRLYIGYKQAGAFQHSSFLHGSRVLAAGQIKVKRGQLRRLSPLSGHYRCKTANFRAFVDSLRENHVDLSRLSISRSYAILIGLEAYVQTKKTVQAAGRAVEVQKERVLHPDRLKEEEERQRDKSQSAEVERHVLERERLAKSQ